MISKYNMYEVRAKVRNSHDSILNQEAHNSYSECCIVCSPYNPSNSIDMQVPRFILDVYMNNVNNSSRNKYYAMTALMHKNERTMIKDSLSYTLHLPIILEEAQKLMTGDCVLKLIRKKGL